MWFGAAANQRKNKIHRRYDRIPRILQTGVKIMKVLILPDVNERNELQNNPYYLIPNQGCIICVQLYLKNRPSAIPRVCWTINYD